MRYHMFIFIIHFKPYPSVYEWYISRVKKKLFWPAKTQNTKRKMSHEKSLKIVLMAEMGFLNNWHFYPTEMLLANVAKNMLWPDARIRPSHNCNYSAKILAWFYIIMKLVAILNYNFIRDEKIFSSRKNQTYHHLGTFFSLRTSLKISLLTEMKFNTGTGPYTFSLRNPPKCWPFLLLYYFDEDFVFFNEKSSHPPPPPPPKKWSSKKRNFLFCFLLSNFFFK